MATGSSSDTPNLAQALATIASAFALNQSGQNNSASIAVLSTTPPSAGTNTVVDTTSQGISRPSSSRLVVACNIEWMIAGISE